MAESQGRDRLHGLDGLRAVAVSMVIFGHLAALPEVRRYVPQLDAWMTKGVFGVEIFFVISGFIITWLLLGEEQRTGTVDVRAFYVRRALRILPPLFLYLFVISILGMLGVIALGVREILASIFFIRNLVEGHVATGHLWSLGIEEQFYIAWPGLFLCCRGRMRTRLLVAAALLALPWRQLHGWGGPVDAANQCRTDFRYLPLALGCLLACLRRDPAWGRVLSQSWLARPATALAAACLVVAMVVPAGDWGGLQWALQPVCLPLGVVMLINGVIHRPTLLDHPALAWIGRLSYSLYLWQELFCYPLTFPEPWFQKPGVNVLLTVVMATFSYYVVEQPLLRLRRQWRRD